MQQLITCSMCGHTFDPKTHAACQTCPLQKNCNLLCCPQCGFEVVNIQQSRLARMMSRLLSKTKIAPTTNLLTLDGINPGQQARVVRFANTLDADRQAHLKSYGLIPGRVIRVVQRSPVTVIQVEHTELAFEEEMAREIQVEVF